MESKKEENEPQTDRQDSKTTFLQIHFLKKTKNPCILKPNSVLS